MISDQEQFQSGDKQCFMEIINQNSHINNLSFSLPSSKNKSKSLYDREKFGQNNIGWKFEKIKKVHLPFQANTSPAKGDNRNISFQTDQMEEISDDSLRQVSMNENKFRASVFQDKYKNCQQVYRKKLMGTNWLGNKQYFASVFLDPRALAKTDISDFNRKSSQNNSKHIAKVPFSFDSQFESGNLHSVFKTKNNQYDLILQNDINSKGNTQWFFFEIANIPAQTKIKFNIVNMLKNDSLFNYGMQPCVFSDEAFKKSGQGWHRSGTGIKYYKNQNKVDGSNRFYYTLSFTLITPYDNDTLRVAQAFPYGVEDLKKYLQNLQKKSDKKITIQRLSAGQTIGKNNLEVVKIFQQNPRKKGQRPLIIITARQHPGETPSSFVCEGFLDFVTSDEKQAIYLRRNYEIYVLPMLNPDGVTVGNYRTNLCGVDLNRRWDGSKSKLALETILVKKYLLEISKNKEVAFCIDLHGHSRKLYSFFYGNSSKQNPLQVRIFPYICAKIPESTIRFQDSTFSFEESKRKTARVQLANKFKIPNVFTFETSLFGYVNNKKQRVHYTQQKLKNLGSSIAKSIFLHQKHKTNPESSEGLQVQKYLNELKNKPSLIENGEKQDSGSETQPEKGEINDEQLQTLLQDTDNNKTQNQRISQSVTKSSKRQKISKQISKNSRQMYAMDIARVNSVFPNDALALMPASGNKRGKLKFRSVSIKEKESTMIQTEEVPLLKIYDSCQEQFSKEQQMSVRKSPNKNPSQKISKNSQTNLFRAVMRPKSSSNSYLQNFPTTAIKIQIRKRHESGAQVRSRKDKITKCQGAQTKVSLSPFADFDAKRKDNLMISSSPSRDMEGSKRKTRASFATVSPDIQSYASRTSGQSFKIGLRALNVETWRIKKRNFAG